MGRFSLVMAVLCFSFVAVAAEFRSGETVDVQGAFTDAAFIAGGDVNADFESTDDVFVAGGNISYSGRTIENLFMAGGDLVLRGARSRLSVLSGGSITITGAEMQDLILAGGELVLEQSQIKDDVILAGGKLRIGKETRIDGTLVVGAGMIHFGGDIGGDAWIAGSEVTLTGRFGGNVRVEADELTIGPGAVIAGDLIYTAREPEISPTAKINGQTIVKPRGERGEEVERGVWAWLMLVGLLLVPPIVTTVFSRTAENGREQIRARFWENLGKGAAIMILVPIALILLCISIIGIPIAITAMPFVFTAWVIAGSVVAFIVGDQIRRWIKRREPQGVSTFVSDRRQIFAWTFAGTVVISLIMMIPFVGWACVFFLLLAGMGALYSQARS